MWRMVRIGVLVDSVAVERHWKYGMNQFSLYLMEILNEGGMPYTLLDNADRMSVHDYDIVIAVVTSDDEATSRVAYEYIESGGTLIAYGGIAELAERMGATLQGKHGVGYANLGELASTNEQRLLRYLSAQSWDKGDANCHELGRLKALTPDGEPAGAVLQIYPVGKGALHRFAVDIPATIVMLQQGQEPVLSDGINAPDGTANVRDGILKADDRIALDWKYDRQQTETGQMYFAHPYADLWRDVLRSHLLRTVCELGLTLPFVDPWPEGVKQVATISHDSDLNLDESALTTLRLLKELDIHTCWCMIEPGFSAPIHNLIREAGHELAFHYNAVRHDNGFWDKDEFMRQVAWCKEALSLNEITSTKNHYTTFEGWGELFEWCESAGIQSDQTRGPSKSGNVGFPFGTCRPYFPIAWSNDRNRIYDVVEIGFQSQDPEIGRWSDSSVFVPFLEQISLVRGVAHFLFHQYHLHTQEARVGQALSLFVQEARKREFVFWTAGEINDWVRSLRRIRIQGVDSKGQPVLQGDALENDDGRSLLGKAVVWVPISNGMQTQAATDEIYGVTCAKYTVNDLKLSALKEDSQ